MSAPAGCRPHIPYRNSMMTIALKDSLGGNCRTTMIATISSDTYQMDESISTCRFAERICAVRNQVRLGARGSAWRGSQPCRLAGHISTVRNLECETRA